MDRSLHVDTLIFNSYIKNLCALHSGHIDRQKDRQTDRDTNLVWAGLPYRFLQVHLMHVGWRNHSRQQKKFLQPTCSNCK
jgi:hypothetical protein